MIKFQRGKKEKLNVTELIQHLSHHSGLLVLDATSILEMKMINKELGYIKNLVCGLTTTI